MTDDPVSPQLRESLASLERKLDERTHELTNALEQQAAIAEILRVMSISPTDVRPVLDVVAERSALLCHADFARVLLVDGGVMAPMAGYQDGARARREALVDTGAVPHDRSSLTGRAAIDRDTLHVADIVPLLDSEYPGARANMLKFGLRGVLTVPLIREGGAYGGIILARTSPGLFAPDQVALVQTFAQQAAIAIDNVRLFNETREALDQQRASGEVLSTISSSIADTTPVFDKILTSCERLFAGKVVVIDLLGGDGLVHLGAYHGPRREEVQRIYPHTADASTATGSAIAKLGVVEYTTLDDAPTIGRSAFRVFGIKAAIGAPMLWEGKGIGAIWVARDVSGAFSEKEKALLRTFADQAVIAIQNARLVGEIRQKSAELEIANQHKSAFLASMSHELRTPLNAIIGFSEVLLARLFGEINAKQDDYLNDIHASGKHLLSLINDVLDLSKVEAGRMELERSTFDLTVALADAMTLVRERAVRHGIDLALAAGPDLGAITADERKVKQIMLNLLSNAVKFTPDGGRVEVRARRMSGGVEIAVHDTGIGIAREDQASVFEEFRQVGRDYTRKAEGTGLGLALTRRFVELHGGRISLQSAPGEGSTFSFHIPDELPRRRSEDEGVPEHAGPAGGA